MLPGQAPPQPAPYMGVPGGEAEHSVSSSALKPVHPGMRVMTAPVPAVQPVEVQGLVAPAR